MGWQNNIWVVSTIIIVLTMVGAGVGVNEVVAQEDDQKNIIARTPPGEDVTVQRGETVALGYPAEEAPSGATYRWEVKEGDTSNLLLHTGSIDAAGDVPAHNGRVTSFRATQEGDYTVSLTVRDGSGNVVETISRNINVESSEEDVSYEKIKEYAPVLRFEEDELYRPTRMEAIFENAKLKKGLPSTVQEFEVFSNANLYDVAVRESPEGQPSSGDMFEFLLPIEVEGIWRGVFAPPVPGATPASAGTDGLVNPNSLTHLDDPDVYPQTVYAQTVEEVEFDPREFDPRGELPRSGEYYEELDRIGEVDLTEDTYTAVGYWMMYVNDPKPEHVRGNTIDSWTSFGKAAGHTGDASVIYILFNGDGQPEWVLNQQHKGGEYRRWEHVKKEDRHPIIYVAQGAHTSFFGTGPTGENVDRRVRTPAEGGGTDLTGQKEKPEYIYQGQYFNTPGEVGIFEDPLFDFKNIEGYVDITAYGNRGHTLTPGNDYEVSFFTDNEAWSNYTGDYLTYPHGLFVGENDGATASKIPQNTSQFTDPGGWAEYKLFPDVAQITGVFSDEQMTFTELREPLSTDDPEDRMQQSVIRPDEGLVPDLPLNPACNVPTTRECIEAPPAIVLKNDRVTPDQANGSVGVNVINTGMQPHEFVLDLDPDRQTESERVGTQNQDISQPVAPDPDGGDDSDNQADYSFYVNSIYPKNVAGAEVPLGPLGINEPGEYTVDADLSIYTDAYKLDDETFELEITEELPDPTLEITEDETLEAGTVERSGIVDMDVSVTGREQLGDFSDEDWSVYVEGEEVGFLDRDSPSVTYDGDGYRVAFSTPDKDDPGTYDVRVELEAEDETVSDEEEDLLAYREPGDVASTATALVIDNSGSMGARDVGGGSRMGAAKDAAHGVIDRQSDSDYVSVVGFSSGSSVRQGLTQLDDGRGSAQSAVASMNDGGSTNMGAGLRNGIDEVMKAPDGVQKNVILMSDGGRNRGPSEAAMRGMIRNRMNPNDICLQTNTLGNGADFGLMRSLNDAADCSENTESFTRDEIVQDFINLTREFDASESVLEETGEVGGGETFEDFFGIDEDTTNAIIDIATDAGATSGLSVQSDRTEHEIDVDDNRSDTDADVRTEERANATGDVGLSALTGTQNTSPGDRDVRLYRPDGSLVDPDNSSEFEVSSTDDRTVYRIKDPEPGDWGYEIDGGDDGTEFEVVITADSLTKMDVETPSDEYYTGSSATLTTTLFGAEPVTGADVEARIEAPDGTSETVTFDEISAGVYRATVDLEEGVSGTYEAIVKAVKEEENVERRATTSWEAEFAAPVSVGQPNVPVVEPGSEGEAELAVESEALLGIRSVELGLSEFAHETTNATIPSGHVSMNRSHLIRSGETVPVDASVRVSSDAPTGVYTAEASAQVDEGGTTVDTVKLRVGRSGAGCVNRRDAGRGDDMCDGDSDLSRGDASGGNRGYDRDERRRDRGRGNGGRGASRRGGGR